MKRQNSKLQKERLNSANERRKKLEEERNKNRSYIEKIPYLKPSRSKERNLGFAYTECDKYGNINP
jgi:hypothetical protein